MRVFEFCLTRARFVLQYITAVFPPAVAILADFRMNCTCFCISTFYARRLLAWSHWEICAVVVRGALVFFYFEELRTCIRGKVGKLLDIMN